MHETCTKQNCFKKKKKRQISHLSQTPSWKHLSRPISRVLHVSPSAWLRIRRTAKEENSLFCYLHISPCFLNYHSYISTRRLPRRGSHICRTIFESECLEANALKRTTL